MARREPQQNHQHMRHVVAIFISMAMVAIGIGAISELILRRASQLIDGRLAADMEELVNAYRLRAETERAARHSRSFVVTGEPLHLEEMMRTRARAKDALDRVPRDNPDARALAAAIEEKERHLASEMDDIIALRKSGAAPSALARLVADTVEPKRQELEGLIKTLMGVEIQHHAQSQASLMRLMDRTTLLVGLLTVLTASLAVLLGILQARAVRAQLWAMHEIENASARTRFLSDAFACFVNVLDPDQLLRELAKLAVPGLADGCAVHLRKEDGSITVVAVDHKDPTAAQVMWDYERRMLRDANEPFGVSLVLREGRADWMSALPENAFDVAALDATGREVLKDLRFRSYIVVPLFARGTPAGALTLILTGDGERVFLEQDVRVAEDLAKRASLSQQTPCFFDRKIELPCAYEFFRKRMPRSLQVKRLMTSPVHS